MIGYEGIKFTREMRCPACSELLARKFSFSFVSDRGGQWIDVSGIGGLTWDEMQATYEIRCACGGKLEFSTPEEADQYTLTDAAQATGPPVARLT